MAGASNVSVPIGSVGKLRIDVQLTGVRQWRCRCAIVRALLWLARLVAPKNVSLEVTWR